ncbi:hypothetical protein [Bacillus tuaregi]|uniref:hypothetical protein n=1 Tax=Bacillus tuaregi TaxID=1816695 RepID=UPI0008F93F48|nr:hypothetical protein [Bacillus tuaregi]
MNTDQAFELLKNAGVAEDVCITTVRRWLRERKITYEGRQSSSSVILDDTDQALQLLKDAGVAPSIGLLAVRRLVREGKIQQVGNGENKEYIPKEPSPTRTIQPSTEDKRIRQLKAKIKAQDDHIKGIEELHQSSINTLIQQRNKLNQEKMLLEKEKNELQRETRKLLKENLDLRNELLKIKEEYSKGNKADPEKTVPVSSKIYDPRPKLGLSKTAGSKDILAGYKALLKTTHPDRGGNAELFHFIKMDYDAFRNSLKDK